jgi:hypothetical protein
MTPRNVLIAAALAAALATTPALANGRTFDASTVADPAALADVRQIHIAMPTLALELDVRRFDTRGDHDRPVRTQDAQAKADDLRKALVQRLSRDYTVVDAPGPGVLVIQPTITWLASSRPTMADFQHTPGLSHESVYAGGAAARFELIRDGRSLGVLSDKHTGSFGDGKPRISLWSDTDEAFQRWARGLDRELAAR